MGVVLLQVREEGPAEDQERLCFLEACGLEPSQLECINLVRQPHVPWSAVEGASAILVGGAGAHSATRSYEFTRDLEDIVQRAVAEGKPFFGSCFGHHVLVTALGGRVVNDQNSGEVGTFDIELTETGRRDPLFKGLPQRFAVQLGHHDRVAFLPAGLEELAYSARCRFQMLGMAGKPIYSSQFHCEMSDRHLLARLEMYRDTYVADRTSRRELSRSLRPSPWADEILGRFLTRFCRGETRADRDPD